jgi:hypothetical protein
MLNGHPVTAVDIDAVNKCPDELRTREYTAAVRIKTDLERPK